MITDRELMQMALCGLERIDEDARCFSQRESIRRLRERLAQPEPEPVAWLDTDGFPWSKEGVACRSVQDTYTPLYTYSPQRTWVGLTDKELFDLLYMDGRLDHAEVPLIADFIQTIQAKLKEKNT